jgi:hypothetical protein
MVHRKISAAVPLEGNGVELAESGMRIFNRAHLPWFIFVLLATTAAGCCI